MSEAKKWHRVSLRFAGDCLPVEELHALLQIEPTSVGKKGERLGGKEGRAMCPTNVWVWSYPSDSEVPCEDQISSLLDLLEIRQAGLRQIMVIPDVEAELYLGFGSENGQGGAYFSPRTLKRISNLGLAIDFDLYPPDIEDDGS